MENNETNASVIVVANCVPGSYQRALGNDETLWCMKCSVGAQCIGQGSEQHAVSSA